MNGEASASPLVFSNAAPPQSHTPPSHEKFSPHQTGTYAVGTCLLLGPSLHATPGFLGGMQSQIPANAGVINVIDYGAVPNDGLDDTAKRFHYHGKRMPWESH